MRTVKKIDNPELFVETAIDLFKPNEDTAVITELVRFNEWIETIEFKQREFPAEKLIVTLTAQAGQGSVSIALQADLSYLESEHLVYANDTEIDMAAVALFKKCFHAYTSIQISLPHIAGPNGKPADDQGANPTSNEVTKETHEAYELEVGNWKGKKTYRIRAGWFSQYGAAVYPETLRTSKLAEYVSRDIGVYPIHNTIDVEVKDGKPKVIAIR